MSDATDTPTAPQPKPRGPWLRLGILAALMIALLVMGRASGLSDDLTPERIQTLMLELGAPGFAAYLALFTVATLAYLPGMPFVFAAILAYGPALGFAAGVTGAFTSITVSFVLVRRIGGQPLGDIQRPFVRRMLAQLEARPVRTIAVLRLAFHTAPWLNYTLAMSKVSYRDYLAGSMLGLVPVIALFAIALDWFFAR